MPTPKRPYIVTDTITGKQEIVDSAASQSAAVAQVTKGRYKAKPASAAEILALLRPDVLPPSVRETSLEMTGEAA